jgi:hypothetical protein
MKTRKVISYLMIATTVGILFTGCRKKEELDNDTSAAQDHALAEGTYNDVHNIADAAAINTTSSTGLKSYASFWFSPCAVITRTDTAADGSGTMTIDFGTTNCTCNDGRTRRGKINVAFTGHYRSPGTVITKTFDNYFVNDNQVMGTHTVTNNGFNASGHLTFNVVVNGEIIKANGGGTVTWTSNRTREWIAGEETCDWSDDVYLITGSASGTNAKGRSFTATIETALRKELSCRHFVSGVISITPDGKPTRTIDYGSGACDDIATVTINGNTYSITLR